MTIPTFERIHTPRLLIRHLRDDDAPRLAAYRNDPATAQYQSWDVPYTEAQALELIRDMHGRQPGQPGWFQFAAADRASGLLIGDLALRTFEVQHGELGFTFSPEVQGQGYATEAASAVLEYAFGTLQLHRVIAGTDPRNHPSARLLRRLGFRHEGRFLESYPSAEGWLDDDQYALLAREWRRKPGGSGADS
ncbi:GNAT family N-acetyltransferase [Deinococcus ruber]|uniref:Ribosomal-protein-serine acetyltransferase n=1 Tax=Deinococcus ruber TaxID=1848197 RepID=A0A918C8U4_9DEIO|nr:GNAT family N-acetyltransferase [Deinococcus ruber]GGR10564.1 ribosomal-protein-serine acetyltransferase [Deinococcus ruber]